MSPLYPGSGCSGTFGFGGVGTEDEEVEGPGVGVEAEGPADEEVDGPGIAAEVAED